jgi:hypothetical protein
MDTRGYLKKVFLPNLCVRPSFQVLDILEYACGLKLGPALTLSKNPIFEMASNELKRKLDKQMGFIHKNYSLKTNCAV